MKGYVTIFLFLVLVGGCIGSKETVIVKEYQCFDGTIVKNLEECPEITTTTTTTNTTTTTISTTTITTTSTLIKQGAFVTTSIRPEDKEIRNLSESIAIYPERPENMSPYSDTSFLAKRWLARHGINLGTTVNVTYTSVYKSNSTTNRNCVIPTGFKGTAFPPKWCENMSEYFESD